MIYVNRILHWEIAKIVSLNDLMQWNIVVRITNNHQTIRTSDTPGLKPFTILLSNFAEFV